MKASTLGIFMSATLAFFACFVDRPSHAFECSDDSDCTGFDETRQCRGGYCVVPNCPEDCTTCDEVARTCLVECTSSNGCGNVTCPSGWTCTINCTGSNACRDIDCARDSKCRVTCTGPNACDRVDCSSACKCDLTCSGNGSCDTPDCPTANSGGNLVQCTEDGTSTGRCDSSPSGCTKC